MTTVALLLHLRQRGVTFKVNGDRLSYDGPEKTLTADILSQLKAAKPALLAILQAERESAPVPKPPTTGGLAVQRDQPDRFNAAFRKYLDLGHPVERAELKAVMQMLDEDDELPASKKEKGKLN